MRRIRRARPRARTLSLSDAPADGRAIRGGRAGREGWTGTTDGRGLATFLGWFSIALGAAELLAPRGTLRAIGVRPSARKAVMLRGTGVREIASGVGILSNPEFEAHSHTPMYGYDRVKQAPMLEQDRPLALREAVMSCRNGGTVAVIGVYAGFIDKFPMGAVVNRSLTIKSGQCHVQKYMPELLDRIQKRVIDPSFVVIHRLPLGEAARGYDMFMKKKDGCEKVVLSPWN